MNEQANSDMILGEMRGQLREMVHGMNSLSAKLDAVSREVHGVGPLAIEVGMLRGEVDKLKASDNRREGAQGVLAALVRSPAAAWVVSFGVASWAVLTGRVQ